MTEFGHGFVGTREQAFTSLLDLREEGYPTHQLVKLAADIKGEVDQVKDGPDPEENLWVPAGYTYFGQFIDHDLTFDNTSSLNPADAGEQDRLPSNLRTPRFDLDSLYGDGPDAQPFLYAEDGASLLFKAHHENQSQNFFEEATQDLLRNPNGRAIIGDKRNDENSIISQIHLAFVKYHNAVVKKLKKDDHELTGTALFNQARNEVRWTYQKLVIEDFLPRIVKAEVLADLQQATTPEERQDLYALYTKEKRRNLPREFVVAAYRFGHSGVRTGYRLNKTTRLSIFPASDENPKPDDDSLLGFEPLPKTHVIDDWGRFFPNTKPGVFPTEHRKKAADEKPRPEVRLQFAYKIDTTLVDPLGVLPPKVLPTSAAVGGLIKELKDTISPDHLPDKVGHPQRPSLALLNLLRGNTYKVQGGQAIANVLKENCFPVQILDQKHLSIRKAVEDKDGFFQFAQIDSSLQTDTPLWFYILAEAQASVVDAIKLEPDGTFDEEQLLDKDGAKTQLGWVGGRIIAEVFYGLLDSDSESYFNAAPEYWEPILGGNKETIFANFLKFAGLTIRH